MGKVNKNAMFFTFIAITLMAIFILVFTPQADIILQKDEQSTKTRINTLDNFVYDLQNRYFETVLRATAYKTMLSLALYINSTGSYLTNFDSAFSSVMTTGKINGVDIDSVTGKRIMFNNTLADWNNRMIDAAKDVLNVNTIITVNNVSAFQANPWDIDVAMNVDFTVASNVAQWTRSSALVATTLSIESLPDPYYLANTRSAGSYSNPIKKSNVAFDKWDLAQARASLRNATYVHWQNSNAPSYLMRFTNTITNSSCCGIESFVNPNNVIPSDQRESYADYLFWSRKFSNNCTVLYNITGLWDEFRYFKLDFDNVIKYSLTQSAVKTC